MCASKNKDTNAIRSSRSNNNAINSNCASMRRQQQRQQISKNNNNNIRQKSRKRCKTKPNSSNYSCRGSNKSHDSSSSSSSKKLLIVARRPQQLLSLSLLLLITMTATLTTTICQTEALAMTAPRQLSLASPLAALLMQTAAATSSAAAAATLLSPTQHQFQQQQLPQQQLFALLTKNRQTSGHQQQQQHLLTASSSSAAADENIEHVVARGGVDGGDDDVLSMHIDNINTSMETSGFVADDGQQYEKAEQVLAAAAAAAGSVPAVPLSPPHLQSVNCPKMCKCLNDFFDCGKQQLERVPELPNYVQIIDLTANKLNDSTVLQITNLPELVKLTLKRNQLAEVPKFVGLTSLKQLNLAGNRIQRINSEALAALPKLKALDLSRNFLHNVESSYFPKSTRLAHLILSYNEISSVTDTAFESLTDLVELDLSNNRLATLPAGVFRSLSKLKKLSLNYNKLEINWSTFKGLISLQKLFLKSNNIRALQDGVFHVMRAIETIELDHNGITSLSRQGLFNLTKLHHLSLSNNSISRIELDTWEFTQSLITLDLSHNNISDFKPQHLDCLQRLRQLNLAHNKLNYLVENTFDCVKNLEDLNLRRNKLSWIIEDAGTVPAFKALRKLKKLDLYGNNLKQINSKSLHGLSSLETLNLGGNSLATIQTGAFEHMPQLQKVNFKSLNFICDCDLLWFRRWLQRTQATHAPSNAVCGYPEHLLDRELLSLTPAELICADTPKPYITQEPNNQLAVKGANITMKCVAMSPAAASLAATDELKIKWRHDNHQVLERSSNGAAAANVQVPGGFSAHTETQIHHDQQTNQTTIIGFLQLHNVSYESAGRYQCVVSNAFGNTYSQKFKMSIGIHPSFLQIPSNLTIDSGDSARLVCSATGDPTPEIALQKFGASQFPAATERRLHVIREENAFIITNAKPSDSGIYTCTAVSAAGDIKINASLVVNDKPQAEIPLMRKEIVLTQPSVIECLTDLVSDSASSSFTQPHREWFKDNKPFHTSATSASERYYFTAAKELLVIVNTQAMDAGHYRCELRDAAKTYQLQTELTVVQNELVQQDFILLGLVLVTVACILIGSCIVWLVLRMQRRKLYFGSIRGGAAVASNGTQSSQHTLSGSRSVAAHDQTQLTTLQRSGYLQQQQQQQQQYQQPLMATTTLSRNNFGINSCDMDDDVCRLMLAAASPSELSAPPQIFDTHSNSGDGGGITLEYLTRRMSRAHEIELHENSQQDHLSSKDSGTGSDAAVKRSIDDFTTLSADEAAATLRAVLAATTTDDETPDDEVSDAADDDADEESDFIEAHAMGLSADYVDVGYKTNARGYERVLQHNNNKLAGDESSNFGATRPDKSRVARACKSSYSGANYNGSAKQAQAVDI